MDSNSSLTRTTMALTSAMVAGVALGLAIQALQGSLGGSSAVLANSGAVWVIVAFALGMAMPSHRVAAIGGAICLVAASICYYVAVDWFEGIASSPRGPVIWSIAGIAAGSAFGFAGFMARHHTRYSDVAWAPLAGVLIGEGIHLTWHVANDQLRPAGIVELAMAAIVVTLTVRRSRSAGVVLTITVAAAALSLLAVSLINRVFASL